VNDQHAGNAGLSRFAPIETTRDEKESAYLITLKDEALFSNGVLLNAGLGLSRFRSNRLPQGELPFIIRPEGASGNFYLTSDSLSRRVEVPVNVTLPGVEWHGRHQIKVGADVDLVTSDQFFDRRDIFILREDGTLSRKASFSNNSSYEKNNFQVSGYAQDRWAMSERLLLELGLRLDRDGILKDFAVSPRIAATYLLTSDGATKISAGAGIFRDHTNLD